MTRTISTGARTSCRPWPTPRSRCTVFPGAESPRSAAWKKNFGRRRWSERNRRLINPVRRPPARLLLQPTRVDRGGDENDEPLFDGSLGFREAPLDAGRGRATSPGSPSAPACRRPDPVQTPVSAADLPSFTRDRMNNRPRDGGGRRSTSTPRLIGTEQRAHLEVCAGVGSVDQVQNTNGRR